MRHFVLLRRFHCASPEHRSTLWSGVTLLIVLARFLSKKRFRDGFGVAVVVCLVGILSGSATITTGIVIFSVTWGNVVGYCILRACYMRLC